MATATTKTKNTFGVSCPHCHSEDGWVALDLTSLDTIRCSECSEEFSATEARDMAAKNLAAWEKVCRFVQFGRELAAE